MRKFIVFAVFIVILGGCEKSETNDAAVLGYFLDQNAGTIVSAEFQYSGDEPAKFAAEQILAEREGVKSAFPYGVHILSLTIGDGLAVIDLSSPFDTLKDYGLTLAQACMVKTLAQFEEITQVRIITEGKSHPFRSDRIFTLDDFLDVAPY